MNQNIPSLLSLSLFLLGKFLIEYVFYSVQEILDDVFEIQSSVKKDKTFFNSIQFQFRPYNDLWVRKSLIMKYRLEFLYFFIKLINREYS